MTAKRRLRRFLPITIALACAWGALGASTAAAEMSEIGQLQPPSKSCNPTEGNLTYFQSTVSSGKSYVVPSDGALVSWSLFAGSSPLVNAKLKVLRPGFNAGQFKVIGESKAGAQSASTFTTFAIEIPVKEGDRIGFWPGNPGVTSNCLTESVAGNGGLFATGEVGLNNETLTTTPYSNVRLPVSALFLPPPIVGSLSPSSGSTAGKTAVTIKGDNLILIKSVTFGGTPAESFEEVSETQATAVAPPGTAGKVDVRVTTIAGQSPLISGDQFTYTASTTPTTPAATQTGTTPSTTSPPAATGKRAAALKKCKGKKSKKAKKNCKKKAKKLPV
jgi:hypothetical protein